MSSNFHGSTVQQLNWSKVRVNVTLRLTVNQSVSQSVNQTVHLGVEQPDINSVSKLLSCLGGASDLRRGEVCPLSVIVSSICPL
jgi:hypothetical protein